MIVQKQQWRMRVMVIDSTETQWRMKKMVNDGTETTQWRKRLMMNDGMKQNNEDEGNAERWYRNNRVKDEGNCE